MRDGGGFSLFAAAEEFDKEEAELAIAQHTALLRDRSLCRTNFLRDAGEKIAQQRRRRPRRQDS